MDAKSLFSDRDKVFIYLERYVNNGSPSGFTDIRTTSAHTNPFTGVERFPLLEFNDADTKCIHLGSKINIFNLGINYAHPDSLHSGNLLGSERIVKESDLIVSPTASGRTMLIRDSIHSSFIKLTYDISRIGRVDRQLALNVCQSSREITDTLLKCIEDGKLPKSFAILRDLSAKISMLNVDGKIFEWGTIYRERNPYPNTNQIRTLVPGFSLFGVDRQSESDEYLLNQLIQLSNKSPERYLVDLLKMIVDGYWGVVLNCAFHLEYHSQNCLFEVDDSYNIVRLVYRDMDSVDKDIPLARQLGLRSEWESYPYSCMDETFYAYKIRSSYMYDFKLGEYLLSPLIEVVAKRFNLNPPEIYREIKNYVQRNYVSLLPATYFPTDGCWYDCDNTERKPGEQRQYYAHKNPKYR